MADLILTVVQEPSDDVGYLAGLAVGDDMIVAVGGRAAAHPTVLASSNARDFETRTTPRAQGLRAVLVESDAVWTCGEGGLLAVSRDHGASWTAIPTGTTGCLEGLACAADGAVWVVGDAGFAGRLPRGGAALETIALGTAARLTSVHAAKSEIVILGDDGKLRRWRAGTVTEVATGSERAVTALAITRGSWIVVGDGGFVGRSPDGAWWSRVKVEAAGGADLAAVTALAGGELVAVGARGMILVSRDDGRTWVAVASELTAPLWSVARLGEGALIGGDEGLIAKLAPAADDAWADRTDLFGRGQPLDAAFVAGPRGFITGGGLATYVALGGGGEADDGAADAAAFRARYGVAVPPEVVALRALTAGAAAGTFAALRGDLAAPAAPGNLFERAVLRDQRAPAGTDLVEAFCGVFALGTLASGDRYHMELDELDGPRQVLRFARAERAFSGVVADSLESLAYLTAITTAGAAEAISRDAYRVGLRKLRGKVAPPSELGMAARDPDFVPLDPKRRDTEFLFFRSRWIRALLAHDGTADIAELFAPHLNQVVPAELLPARFEACEKRISTALYATWRAYLFDEPELPRYLEIARAHAAQLVRDAAQLIGELLAGRNELGTITDVRGWLAAFRALDLDPRRTGAVEARPAAAAADEILSELARTAPAAWADLAWRWLDDGAAQRVLLARLGAADATGRQLAALAALGELPEEARAIALPRLAAELAPALEAVLVGSLVRGDAPTEGEADDEGEDTDDKAPGWDAIDAALEPIYKGQEPRHYGTVLPAMLGGNDPLHGISAYVRDRPVPHFHFITYGFTDLFRKETDDPEESGFGFELTLRLVRSPDEDTPPPWALNFLQNLARYVFGSGNRFAAGHKMGLNGPIALDMRTKITAILFADDAELGAIESPFGAARFVQIVGITDDEYKLIQEWSTTGLVDMLKTQWPYLTTDLARGSLLDDPEVAAEVRRRVAAEGSSEDLSFGGDLTISAREGGGVTLRLGALYAASLPRAMRGRLQHERTYELRGRGAQLRLAPGPASGVVLDEDGATLTLAPALVVELEAQLRDARAGTYTFAAFADLEIIVTPTFIRDQSGQATDVRGVADPAEAQALLTSENARLEAAESDGDGDGVGDGDGDDPDVDEDASDDDEPLDDPPDPVAIRAALAMTGRALALSPDDDDTQFTHAMLLLDLGRTGDDESVDKLLEILPTFEEATRLNIATRMGKAEHPRFGEAVDLALGDSLPERILAGSTTPADDGSEISSFGDAAEEIYEELGEAILAHAPDRMPRFVSLLPDSIPLLAKLAYHAAKSTLRDQAITLYERVVALPMPDDGDERTEYLRALNNLCIHLHAAGQLEAAALVADRAQPVAHENPFIYHAAACAYVGVGDFARALQQVRLAIEHRYENLADLEHDADLGSLRDMPEFQAAFRDWHARQEGN